MHIFNYTYEEFKEFYAQEFNGWLPAYVYCENNIITVEMICNFRLLDRKNYIMNIRISNKEEFLDIQNCIKECGDLWKTEFIEMGEKLEYV